MGDPPLWIADKVGIRITVYGGGYSGYLLCDQRLEEKTWNLCLPLLVASEIMPGGYGSEEINRCQMTELKFQSGFGAFQRLREAGTKQDLNGRLYD